jgi:hypothetical protein
MLKNIFRKKNDKTPPERVRLVQANLDNWPSFKKLHDDKKVVFDTEGRLRYPHGAPVGDLVLIRTNKDGTPKYKESAEEWFDPDSPKATKFKWPK